MIKRRVRGQRARICFHNSGLQWHYVFNLGRCYSASSPYCGRRRSARHNFIASWEKLSTALIMQLATGPLVSRTASGLPASRRQRRESLSRGAGDETAVAETSDRTTHVLGQENVRREHRFQRVASRIIRSPRCVWSGLNTRWGYRLTEQSAQKAKGERSIWQSSERKVDGLDHVAHSHACRFSGECSLPGSFRYFGNRLGGAIK
jgi:hypothetical protein